MRPREQIIDLFSTFLQFESDRSSRWIIDPRLRRSMMNCQQQANESPTKSALAIVWAQYWHRRWQAQPDRLAEGHLSAYLQESCYWAAQKTTPRTTASHTSSQYLISDCFQIAIAEVPRILKKCNSDHSLSLKAYATVSFSNFIRERLRRQNEINLCSDWGLLLRLSGKQLRESLENAGINAETIAAYTLAWTCFQTLYPTKTPGTRRLSAPDPEIWNAIVQRYNRDRQSLPEASAQTLETWLRKCVTTARQYLYPSLMSLNSPKPGRETSELQDDLPGSLDDSLLAELIEQEEATDRQGQRSQLEAVLLNAIEQLKPQSQQLLKLYYQQNQTQQEIAQQLDIPQYTVSRRLAKAREILLNKLLDWSEAEAIEHNSPDVTMIKTISILLDEWLQSHYNANNPDSEYVL